MVPQILRPTSVRGGWSGVEMDPETIVLVVVTNLSTRLVVIPLRTESVADVCATIKAYHEAVFPECGNVDITAVEVELLGGRARLPDSIAIGMLFLKELRGILYAQLTPTTSNALNEPRRVNLAGPTELDNVAAQQNHDEHLTPSPPGTHGQLKEHDTPEPGRQLAITLTKSPTGPSSSSNLRRPVSDHTNRGVLQTPDRNSDVVEEQVRKKRKVDKRKGLHNLGEILAAERTVGGETVEPVTEKSSADGGHLVVEKLHGEYGTVSSKSTEKDLVTKSLLVVESRDESSSSDGSGCSQKLGHPVTEELHQETNVLISKPIEKIIVDKSSKVLEFRRESQTNGSSGRSSQSGQPVTVKVAEERGMMTSKPTDRDSVAKNLLAVKTILKSSSTDSSDSSSQSGDLVTKKVFEEPGMATSKPDEKGIAGRNVLPVEITPGSSSGEASGSSSSQYEPQTASQQRTSASENQAVVVIVSIPAKEVPSDGMQGLKMDSTGGSSETTNSQRKSGGTTSDGSTTCESSGQSEKSRQKNKILQGKDHSSNDDKVSEISPKEGSKSDSPGGCPGRENSDHDMSEGVSLHSTEESESDSQGSSNEETDGSKDPLSRVSSRRLAFRTPDNDAGAGRSIGRRSVGGSIDLKYQHLLDSQDGFDELISLSQQKLKVIPGQQQERQSLSLDELHNPASPAPLIDDSLSIDIVRDTQVEDGNRNVSSQRPAAVEHLEENIKEIKSSTVEIVPASISVVEEDSMPKEPCQDGMEAGGIMKSKSQPSSSVKTREISEPVQGKEESVTVKGDVATKDLESDEEPPQARSEDSQQIRAAVQLARMSAVKDLVETPPSTKRRKKKGISRLDQHVPVRFHESSVDGLKDLNKLQDSNRQEESLLIDTSPLLLHKVGTHNTEKNSLLCPNQNMEGCVESRNVVTLLEADEVVINQVDVAVHTTQPEPHVAEDVASDPLSGRKKFGKRKHKVLQAFTKGTNEAPLEDIRKHPDAVEKEEETSQCHSVLPQRSIDAPANEEHRWQTASSDYNDLALPQIRTPSETASKGAEKNKLSLKQERVHKLLRKEDNQEVEETPDLTKGGMNERVFSDRQNLESQNDRTVLEEDVPEEKELLGPLSQRKLLEASSPAGKKKLKRDKAGEGKQHELRINMESAEGAQRLTEDIEPGNLTSEVTPGHVSRMDLIDAGIGQDDPLAENLTPRSEAKRCKDEAARKETQNANRRLSAESGGNSSRPKKPRKKDRGAKQGHKNYDSTSVHQEDFDLGLNESSLQVQDMEQEEINGKEDLLTDEKYSNIVVDKGDNRCSLTVVLDETKKPRRKTVLKRVPYLKTSLMREKARQIRSKEGKSAKHIGDCSIESGKAYLPSLVTENVEDGKVVENGPPRANEQMKVLCREGAEAMPSSLKKQLTSKKNSEILKLPKKQNHRSKVAEEMEQFDGPTASGGEGEHPISKLRADWKTLNRFTPKEKRKKKKSLEFKPSPEVGNRRGDEVHNTAIAGHIEQGDQATTPFVENVRKLSFKGSSARNARKGLKNREVIEEEFFHEELPNKKEDGSKYGGTSRSALDGNLEPASAKKQGNLKKRKQGDNSKSLKRKSLGSFVVEEMDPQDRITCPHGCGKVYRNKSSSFYRHRKLCFLGHSPST